MTNQDRTAVRGYNISLSFCFPSSENRIPIIVGEGFRSKTSGMTVSADIPQNKSRPTRSYGPANGCRESRAMRNYITTGTAFFTVFFLAGAFFLVAFLAVAFFFATFLRFGFAFLTTFLATFRFLRTTFFGFAFLAAFFRFGAAFFAFFLAVAFFFLAGAFFMTLSLN
jgi:hypothetical protein